MNRILRTTSSYPDFAALVQQLDADLAERDGQDHAFYAQFNKIDLIQHAVVAYENDLPVGCGAMKMYEPGAMEVKRMYSLPAHRGKGLASAILAELEKWAQELGNTRCILETGKRQPEAIALYLKQGYRQIENYGQYAEVENSVCFEKMLR